MSKLALDRISERFPSALVQRYVDRAGGEWGVVDRSQLLDVLALVKNDAALAFKLFLSLEGVDRLQLPENDPRFEVVYFVHSLVLKETLRLKVRVSEDDPVVPSAHAIYQGTNWWERLTFDFYGITFSGHPDLRRILLYEEFKGHPLRKDYALRDRQPLIPERPLKDIFRGPGTSGVQ